MAAARQNPPSDRVPYAFEKRVMARLTAARKTDEWQGWAQALWRGAVACLAVALLAGAWSWSPVRDTPADTAWLDLEQAILDSVDDLEAN